MFTIYDLTCDGLRDPKGISGTPTLAWRTGSTRQGARQACWHVLVTSVETGRCLWDTGVVHSDACAVSYAGEPLEPAEVCVWCVEAQDDQGEQATSVPAAFFCAAEGTQPSSEAGPACESLLWTSSDALNEELEREREGGGPASERIWRELLGVHVNKSDACCLSIAPRLGRGLSFVQGSWLLPRGLLVVRWELEQDEIPQADACSREAKARVEITLAPGMRATLELEGERQTLCSGHYVLEGVALSQPC